MRVKVLFPVVALLAGLCFATLPTIAEAQTAGSGTTAVQPKKPMAKKKASAKKKTAKKPSSAMAAKKTPAKKKMAKKPAAAAAPKTS